MRRCSIVDKEMNIEKIRSIDINIYQSMYAVTAITLFERITREKSQLITITGANYCYGTAITPHSTLLIIIRTTHFETHKQRETPQSSLFPHLTLPDFITRHISNKTEDSNHINFRSMRRSTILHSEYRCTRQDDTTRLKRPTQNMTSIEVPV